MVTSVPRISTNYVYIHIYVHIYIYMAGKGVAFIVGRLRLSFGWICSSCLSPQPRSWDRNSDLKLGWGPCGTSNKLRALTWTSICYAPWYEGSEKGPLVFGNPIIPSLPATKTRRTHVKAPQQPEPSAWRHAAFSPKLTSNPWKPR